MKGDSRPWLAEGWTLTDLDCISRIVQFLNPKDVARAACVCREFKALLDSDVVWGQFVPQSSSQVLALNGVRDFETKRRMFEFLCRPFLLRDSLAYWLDQDTRRGVCYSVAARGLRVVWGDDERYWCWGPQPGARWPEAASLLDVCWFHLTGSIRCLLPPGAYTLSWRIQYGNRRHDAVDVHGWNSLPAEFSVSTTDGSQATTSHRYLSNRPEIAARQSGLADLTPVRLVDYNWLEYDAGEFTVVAEEKEISLDFSMSEIESGTWKGGVTVDGVVLRPTSLVKVTGRYLSMQELGEITFENEQSRPGMARAGNIPPLLRRGRTIPMRRGGILRPMQGGLLPFRDIDEER